MSRISVPIAHFLFILLAFFTAPSALISPALAQQKLPAEAFARLPFIEKPVISPDGNNIAGLAAVEGEQQIAILPLNRSWEEGIVRLPVPDDVNVNWIRWANDNYVLLGITSLMPVFDDDIYVTRVLSIEQRTGKLVRLLRKLQGQNAGDLLWLPKDGSEEILVAGQGSFYTNQDEFWPSVYRVNVRTGRSTREQRGSQNVMDWAADADGNVRLGILAQDGTGIQKVLYRPDGKQNFRTIQKRNLRDNQDLDLPFMFVSGTDNGLFLRDNSEGRKIIKEINLLTQEEMDTRLAIPDADIESVYLSFDGKSLLGVRTSDKTKPIHWIDERMIAAQAFLDQAVQGANPRIVSFDRNLSTMLVRISSAQNPGLYYVYKASTQELIKLAAVNSTIGNRRLAEPKYVSYKARDDLEIQAVLTLPKGREAKNLPLIAMPHGGPWQQDRVRYDYWAQFLANRGYAVLQPNFRGSTGYGKAFELRGDGQIGLAMQDDITDGVNWLVEQGIADAGRVCIMGGSYGGYAAMWGIAKDPDLYRCAISIAGVSNLRKEVNDFSGALFRRTYEARWQRMSDDFSAVSPINAIEKIKAPLLLIHGVKDQSVNHKQSVSMEKAMKKAGKQVEFISLREADHYFTRQADRVVLLESIERFLAEHNPAD